MHFKRHDALRLFVEVARYASFSDAGLALHMTKGAISYQIKSLEADLGFELFDRQARGVRLTARGQDLLTTCRQSFGALEDKVRQLRAPEPQKLTVGLSTYFASRWLSPRLMGFMQAHPDIQLRLQPLIDFSDLAAQDIDLAIRWGRGEWHDVTTEPFFACPAWPVGNRAAAETVAQLGLERAFASFTLLRDRDGSNAWSRWFDAAGLALPARSDSLIIPDPNVRVQAVIDGQGIALNDALINDEIDKGRLVRLAHPQLDQYGYFLVYPADSPPKAAVQAFVQWLRETLLKESTG
ncbi:LysR substrate-binding domain-containing protein [Rhodovibrionaceae bacterium A322]